ncbi:unnamed protein product, partial [Leptidea sinapis]
MYLLLVSVVLLLWYLLFRYKRRRLYQLAEPIPGIEENLPFLGVLKHSYNAIDKVVPLLEYMSRESFNTGGILKIWAGHLFFIALTNPADIKFVSKNCLEKDLLVTKSLRSVIGDAGIFAPVSIWSRRRKVLVSAFSPKILNSLMDVFSRRSAGLAGKLKKFSGCGTFDIWPSVNSFTLGSVAETSLGIKDINVMKDVMVSDFLNSVAEVFKLVTNRLLTIWLWSDWIYKFTWQHHQFTIHNNTLINLTNNIIRKKRNDLRNVDMNIYENQTIFGQGDDKVDSFLDHLILLSQRHNGFTDTELREEMTTFLLAVRVLDDDGEKLFKDMLSDLKYLDMVLKESLRLFPPTPLIIRKTTNEITLPSGYTVPAETGIIISIWGAHRDPNYWGPDADWFKPERFEAGGKTGLYIPFSTGPRNCV